LQLTARTKEDYEEVMNTVKAVREDRDQTAGKPETVARPSIPPPSRGARRPALAIKQTDGKEK